MAVDTEATQEEEIRQEEVAEIENETQEQPGFADLVKEIGFEVGENDTEETLRDRLIAAYREQQEQLNQTKTKAQEFEAIQPMLRQLLAARSEQPTETAPHDAEQKPWWNPPQVDPMVVQKYLEVVDGKKQLKPDAPEHIRRAVQELDEYTGNWADDIVFRPDKALKPFKDEILSEVRRLVTQELEGREQQTKQQTVLQQLISQHEDTIYVKDPLTGRANRNQMNPQVDALMAEAERDYGITDLTAQLKFALRHVGASGSTASAKVNAPDKKREFLNRTTPEKRGTFPAPGSNRQQDTGLTLRQIAEREYERLS